MSNITVDAFVEQLQDQPLATVCEYYAGCLAGSSKAIDYLRRHALFVPKAHPLKVGFVDRTLGKHVPPKSTLLGKSIRSQLAALGIYRPNGREHFRGMVTVPLQSLAGEVTGLYGRRVDMNNGGEIEHRIGTGIFNAQALRQFDEIIVADNLLDAWTFYAAGHTQAVCAVDSLFTAGDLAHVKRVLLASPTIDCQPLTNCEVHRIQFPLGHTANSYAIQYRHETDPLAKLIRCAPWLQGSGSNYALAPGRAPSDAMSDASGDATGETSGDATGETTVAARVDAIDESTTVAVENAKADSVSASPTDSAIKQSVVSPAPNISDGLDVQATDTETTITIESRRWRIRGLQRNTASGVMKVNIMVFHERTERFHVDTFDLYHARSRRTFTAEAAEEIGAAEPQLRSDLGQVLLRLEQLQHEQTTQSKRPQAHGVQLTEDERAQALALLRDENLLERILDDFETCGIVGERTGKLVGYLATTSRLLDKPLGLVIQSSSAAGKSSLADAILRFMPEEQRFTCSAMTSQSLYYLGNENLKHKILSIAEEEGVRDASYQLKLLQSEGHLSLVSTSKEKGSGRTSTERYTVEGPVQLLLTTTATDLDPELMNRCLVVSVDESPGQTAAIHAQQRFARTLHGFTQKINAEQLVRLHQNAQRLLKPLQVYNPYAEQLGFIGSQTRYRRDHEKYLTLINTITLLHQYQREIKTAQIGGQSYPYLEVTRHDIALANRIADWALGRSIDELPGPTRRLLMELHDWIGTEARKLRIAPTDFIFNRRQAREALQWNTTWLRHQLEHLVAHEYVIPHGRGQGRLHRYSLLFDGRGREGQPSLLGLVDAASLVEPATAAMTRNLAQD